MSDLRIVRGPRLLDHFTMIPDWLARHPQLPFRAVGLMCELLSHQAGWTINATTLAAGRPEGRDAVRTALTQLRGAGLVSKEQARTGEGTFATFQRATCRPGQPVTSSETNPWDLVDATDARDQDRFLMLHNDVCRSGALSFRELGVLVAALSWPAGCEINTDRLHANRPDGRDVARKAVTGLERAGYVHRRQTKSAGARFGATTYYVFEEPLTMEQFEEYHETSSTPAHKRRAAGRSQQLEGQVDLLELLDAAPKDEPAAAPVTNVQVTPTTENPYPVNPAAGNPTTDDQALTEHPLEKNHGGGGRTPHQRASAMLDPLDVPRDEFGPRTWRCALHAHDDRDVPCRGCAIIREEFEEAAVARRAARAAARRPTPAPTQTQPVPAGADSELEAPVDEDEVEDAEGLVTEPAESSEEQREQPASEELDEELAADLARCLAEGMTHAQWVRDLQRRQHAQTIERQAQERAEREAARQEALHAKQTLAAGPARPVQDAPEPEPEPEPGERVESAEVSSEDVEPDADAVSVDVDEEQLLEWPRELARPAIVLDADCIGLPSGAQVPVPAWPRHVGELTALCERFGVGTKIREGWWHQPQVWITDAAWSRIFGVQIPADLPADHNDRLGQLIELTKGHPFLVDAVKAGYDLSGAVGQDGDALLGWATVRKGDASGIRVVPLIAINTRAKDMPVVAGDPAPGRLARRLSLLQTELGHPWVVSAGTTGFDHIRELRPPGKFRTEFAPLEPSPAAMSRPEDDFNWSVPRSRLPEDARYLLALDRTGSYLTGVMSTPFGIGEPQHIEGPWDGDPAKTYGYGLVEITAAGDTRIPNLLDFNGRQTGQKRWRTMTTIAYANELGYACQIEEAYIWPTKSRILDGWYKALGDARNALNVPDTDALAARAQLKVIYTRTIGLMESSTYWGDKHGYAPDRRHTIIARARANLLRRIIKIGNDPAIGMWPVAVTTDTVVYATSEPDPAKAFAGDAWAQHLGDTVGKLHFVGGATVDELGKYLTGRGFGGLGHLDKSWTGKEI